MRRAARAKRASASGAPTDFMHLRVGHRYAVVRAFADYDGETHPVGETWTYVRHNYDAHTSAASPSTSTATTAPNQIQRSWRGEDQGPIIDALADYVHPAPGWMSGPVATSRPAISATIAP